MTADASHNFPDYPFTGHHFDRPSPRGVPVSMHYLDEGDATADPMVMVHGNPSWSFYYRKLVLAFRDRFRCVVPDHMGMGLSDKPAIGNYRYTFEQRIDDFEALLDHLGVTKNITLVVHDWGGMIGFAYATRYPQRIKQIVVLNTGAFHLPKSKPMPWQLKACRSPLGPVLVRGLNGFCRYAIKHCVVKPMAADVANAYLAPYDSWDNRAAVLRFVRDIPLKVSDPGYAMVTDVQRRLPALRDLPMLICWGMRDFVFDKHFLAQWEHHFPDADVHRFEDAGHYVLEDAGDKILPLIESFVG